MTDDDIIKALECCKNEGIETCRDCPLFQTLEFDDVDDFDCGKYLYERAIDLINRQKAEIVKLEKIEHFADKTIEAFKVENEKQKAEIERLQNSIKEADNYFSKGEIGKGLAVIINLVKEMAGE